MATKTTSRDLSSAARTKGNCQRTPRVNPPHRIDKADLSRRERMLEQVYRVTLEFANAFGISENEAARLFTKARRSLGGAPYRLRDALEFEVMLRISEAFKAWYAEPHYLDDRGAPTPLPLSGPKSVETLIARFLPEFKARELGEWLVSEGLLHRNGAGLLSPLRRTVMFARTNAMMLDRMPFILQGLLSTVGHNADAKRKPRDTRCERLLTLDRFRIDELPRFHREVKKLAALLLNQIESWAMPYQEPEGSPSRRKTARVCVEVFASSETTGARLKRGRAS